MIVISLEILDEPVFLSAIIWIIYRLMTIANTPHIQYNITLFMGITFRIVYSPHIRYGIARSEVIITGIYFLITIHWIIWTSIWNANAVKIATHILYHCKVNAVIVTILTRINSSSTSVANVGTDIFFK